MSARSGDESDEWARRARGWIRVLQWDAWGSMVIYTISTVAFFLLGAAVGALEHPAAGSLQDEREPGEGECGDQPDDVEHGSAPQFRQVICRRTGATFQDRDDDAEADDDLGRRHEAPDRVGHPTGQ